jgi:SecD/SecF fusion protein
VLAAYAILRFSVGSTFIACMLTIVGYSINATIVIFDRIRENLEIRRAGQPLEEIVDRSITQTLTRSVFTSLTTFFMVLTLYIFGVATVKEFALPIMTGIIAGGFSSVCLAGPIWYMLRGRLGAGKSESAPKQGGRTDREDYNPHLSKKERKALRQKEVEARNKAKTVI